MHVRSRFASPPIITVIISRSPFPMTALVSAPMSPSAWVEASKTFDAVQPRSAVTWTLVQVPAEPVFRSGFRSSGQQTKRSNLQIAKRLGYLDSIEEYALTI